MRKFAVLLFGLAGGPATPPALPSPYPPPVPGPVEQRVPITVRRKRVTGGGRARAGEPITVHGEAIPAESRYFTLDAARLEVVPAGEIIPLASVEASIRGPLLTAVLAEGLPVGVYDAHFVITSASAVQRPGPAIRLMVAP